jgi:phosphonate degradation associated HDIG domain protein
MNQTAGPSHHSTIEKILKLFRERGNSQYGREAVSQLEHALQVALLAEQAGSSAALIAAGLLHDVGHLLHHLPEDAPLQGLDDHHEVLAARWLGQSFGPEVAEPVRLHVAAKRYLCSVEPDYQCTLSPPSLRSLQLQGGPMSEEELRAFRAEPHFAAALLVRRWDDAAKVPRLPTPPVEHFASYLDRALAQPQT